MDLFASNEESVEINFKRPEDPNHARPCPLSLVCELIRPKRGVVENKVRNVKPRIDQQSESLPDDGECSSHELNVVDESSELLSSVQLVNQTISSKEHKIEPEEHRSNGDTASTFTSCSGIPFLCLHINGLPHLVLVHIFRQLPLTDRLLRVALVCRYWRQLTHDPDLWRQIDFRGRLKVNDDVLAKVVRFSKRVTSVDLTDCKNVTEAGVENMLSVCKNIQKLSIVRCQHFTKRTFTNISETNKHLHKLNLSCCFALDDISIIAIASSCRMLRDLKLNQCFKVTDDGITELVKLCTNLEALSVDQCTKLKGSWIEALIGNCSQLKMLSCKECPLLSENIKLLSQLRHLTHLEISNNSNVTDGVVISLIHGCRQLECLNLSLCHLVTNDAVDHLAKYGHRLKSLHLVSCSVSNTALESLAKCPALQTLDVAYCNRVTFSGANLVSSQCKDLRYLGLMRCDQITNEEAETLAKKFPRIHFSTVLLDYKRVIDKANQHGLLPPGSRGFESLVVDKPSDSLLRYL